MFEKIFDKFFKTPRDGKNITPKILAIILAIVLWLYVMNEQNPPIESSFTIPLEVRNVAANLVIGDVPAAIRVKVRGPRSIVAGVLSQDLRAYIDVKGLTEGQHNVKVGAGLPSSLKLVEVSPDIVPLKIDTTISRQVPVEVRLSGAPAPNAVVGKAVANYGQVTIEGPKNIVDAVEKVVAGVDLSGRNADFTVGAPLVPVDSAGKHVEGLTIYPDRTGVSISVAGELKKMLDVKLVTKGELPSGLVIKNAATQPAQVEVREKSPGKTLEKLEAIITEPVDLTEITTDTVREVRIVLPEGLTATPETVILTLGVAPR